jgi:hypothetical protein
MKTFNKSIFILNIIAVPLMLFIAGVAYTETPTNWYKVTTYLLIAALNLGSIVRYLDENINNNK